MRLLTILLVGSIVGGCSLPAGVYRSSDDLTKYSNFELCRALLDTEERRRAGTLAVRAVKNEIRSRGGDKDACLDEYLKKYSENTMCRDYQRAVARGEPTALVGFAANIKIQDLEDTFERNDVRCDPRGYAGDTRSGLEVLSDKVDEYNQKTRERRNENTNYDCRYTASGVRCSEY